MPCLLVILVEHLSHLSNLSYLLHTYQRECKVEPEESSDVKVSIILQIRIKENDDKPNLEEHNSWTGSGKVFLKHVIGMDDLMMITCY